MSVAAQEVLAMLHAKVTVTGMSLAIIIVILHFVSAQNASGTARRYALLVGVKDYDHSKLRPLAYPENDAADMARLLEKAGYEVNLLTSSEGRRRADRAPTLAN